MRYAGLLPLALAVFMVAKYAVWIGLAVAIVAALFLLWKLAGGVDRCLCRREERRAAARYRRGDIARRADDQNTLFLAGDPRGIYGDYPPAVFAVDREKGTRVQPNG